MSGQEKKGTRRSRNTSLVETNAEDFDVDGRVMPGYYVAHFNSPRRPTRKDEANSDNEDDLQNYDSHGSDTEDVLHPQDYDAQAIPSNGSRTVFVADQTREGQGFLDSPPPVVVVRRNTFPVIYPTPPQDTRGYQNTTPFQTLRAAAQSASPTTPAADTVADEAWNAPY